MRSNTLSYRNCGGSRVTRFPTPTSGRQPKDNPRFVVTNLKTRSRYVYEAVYCARGDADNRLKELKLGLEIDHTSGTSFLVNQLRVLMTAAAYVLMQELRLKARRTGCARAQVGTLRLRLLKLGGVYPVVGSAYRHPLANRLAVRPLLAPHRLFGRWCCDLTRSSRPD
ncbi:MAG: transposase [Candidatus Tectomicrobia bacterium]|nr:transposase [Candidatus Tectomicrobia bacterium]